MPASATFTLQAGDVVKIAGTPRGVRPDFAVAGGFAGETILEGRSTLERMVAGNRWTARDRIVGRSAPFRRFSAATANCSILFVPCPARIFAIFEARRSSAANTKSRRRATAWACGSRGRRAGRCRAAKWPSETVWPGAVQVTNDGLPRRARHRRPDHRRLSEDRPRHPGGLDPLGQLRPGSKVRFVKISAGAAETAAAERTAFSQRMAHAPCRHRGEPSTTALFHQEPIMRFGSGDAGQFVERQDGWCADDAKGKSFSSRG